jgi:hypothetical protein
LLKTTDQLEEAESLYRRALAIDEERFGPNHPNVGMDLNNLAALLAAINRLEDAESNNYAALLAEMGLSSPQILGRLNELSRPFEVNFGSRALTEIARRCQDYPTLRSQPALSTECRKALTLLLRKAATFLGFKGSGVHPENQDQRDQDHSR